jgi:hypothetical protein
MKSPNRFTLFSVIAVLAMFSPFLHAAEEDRPRQSSDAPVESVLKALVDNAEAATEAAADQGGQVQSVVDAVLNGALSQAKDALAAVQEAQTTQDAREAAADASEALQNLSDASAAASDAATVLNAPETAAQLDKVESAATVLAAVVADSAPSDILAPAPRISRSLTAAAKDYVKGAERVDEARAAYEKAKETLTQTESEVSGAADELRSSVGPKDRYKAFNLGDGSVLVVVFRSEGTEIISLQAPGL